MNKSLVLVMCDVLVLTLLSLTSFETDQSRHQGDRPPISDGGGMEPGTEGDTPPPPPTNDVVVATNIWTNIVVVTTNIWTTNIVVVTTNIVVDPYTGPKMLWDRYAALTNSFAKESALLARRKKIAQSVCEVIITYKNGKRHKQYFAPVVRKGEVSYTFGRFKLDKLKEIGSVSALIGKDRIHVEILSASYLKLDKNDDVVLFRLSKNLDGVGLSLGQRIEPRGILYRVSSTASVFDEVVSEIPSLPSEKSAWGEAYHKLMFLDGGDMVISDDSAAVVMLCLPGPGKKLIKLVGGGVDECSDSELRVTFKSRESDKSGL